MKGLGGSEEFDSVLAYWRDYYPAALAESKTSSNFSERRTLHIEDNIGKRDLQVNQ